MEHPKTIGDRTTLAVMQALHLSGYAVLVPFGENTRYDLVIDDGQNLARVQCKTGRLRNGAVRFATCSHYRHHAHPQHAQRDYIGEVDYFAVYCPETARVYFIPITDLEVRARGALRVEPSRNGQRQRIRNAADYEIAQISLTATRALRASSGAR